MKPKTIMLLVVAIGCGLVASYMTSRLLAERQQQQQVVETKVKVLVAKSKVPSNTVLKEPEKFFIEKEVPEDTFPKKAIRTFDDIRGKRLSRVIGEESYVTVDDVLTQESDGLAAVVPAGMRAIAIKVNAESSTAGFVTPHTRVDVVSTVRRGDTDSESKVILQNMLVLAVDAKTTKHEEGPSILGQTVTLAATPEEALQLTLAQAIGELRLILRGAGDNETSRFRSAKVGDLGRQRHDPNREKAEAELTGGASLLPTSIPAPPVVDLPPVVAPEPKEEVKVPDEPPPVTHTLTIINGDYTSKVVFVKDKQGGWNAQVSQAQPLDGTPRRSSVVVPPPPVVAPMPPAAAPVAPPAPPAKSAPDGNKSARGSRSRAGS